MVKKFLGVVTQDANGQFVLQDSLIRKMLRDTRNNKMIFSLIVATIWESSLAALVRVQPLPPNMIYIFLYLKKQKIYDIIYVQKEKINFL